MSGRCRLKLCEIYMPSCLALHTQYMSKPLDAHHADRAWLGGFKMSGWIILKQTVVGAKYQICAVKGSEGKKSCKETNINQPTLSDKPDIKPGIEVSHPQKQMWSDRKSGAPFIESGTHPIMGHPAISSLVRTYIHWDVGAE